MKYQLLHVGISIILFCSTVCAQEVQILPLRERAALHDRILKERFETVLPGLMARTEIDTWVIISREYNEDPIIKTMLPATWMAARRRTILVLHKDGEKVNGYAVARYDVGEFFKRSWEPEKEPDQWKSLADLLAQLEPDKIGLNYSLNYGHADGLNKTEYELFIQSISNAMQKKIVSAEPLAVGWLETRSSTEVLIYEQLCRIAHNIIAEGFSTAAITPGVTTTDDLVWWFRQKVLDLGLDTWFHPTVNIQRADPENFDHLRSFSKRADQQLILAGDLLHVDFGITYLGLNTDTQQHAYVLRANEKDIPEYLKQAFKQGNAVQDHLTSQFKKGASGNEMLARALAGAKAAGLKPTIYTHPIGFHGHAAGPTIGMWDQQGGVPGSGDYTLNPNTAYSIELNAAVYLKEWNKEIRIMLEEEAFFEGSSIYYIDGRQEAIYAIPR